MKHRKVHGLAFVLVAVGCACVARAGEPSADEIDFFEKQVRPLLVDHCYKCHSIEGEKVKGQLLLDTREGVLRGGENGAVIVPGEPEKSRLIHAVRYNDSDLQMPPKEQLSAEQVAVLEKWVKMGAPDPRKTPAAPLSTQPAPFDFAKEKQFWSFQPVKDVAPPEPADRAGLLSPIDAFVQLGYEQHHLHGAKPAGKRSLLRRATYDLTGLPPTPEEVDAFVSDSSPNAFEKVIDRLLASPHYGEQWGRHWLDLVRYADTSGCNSDFPIPQAYRYRNYVIDAFNKDKPYDQFLREQLAGDLLPAKDDAERREHLIATGYLAISRRFGSGASEFHLTIADTIDNMGKSMLGLSLGCARCHDHKFDPVPTSDYYALYGIFASTKYSFPGTELFRHPHDLVAMGPPQEAERLHEYEQRMSQLDRRIHKLSDDKLHLDAKIKQSKDLKEEPKIGGLTLREITEELNKDREEQRQLDAKGIPDIDVAYGAVEGDHPHDANIQKKGDPETPGPAVRRGFLQVLGGQVLSEDEKGSGRLELAQWVTDPGNPLVARVMANRIWQYHFGRGVVASPNDFGHRGQPPTDPALLDYLAARLVKGGWSVKAMHKLLMLSRTYQMSAEEDPADAALDPGNEHLWHFNPRRLSAEEIRDSVLAASGSLDAAVDPGPHPFPPTKDWHYTQHTPFVADYPTTHRTVYLMQQRIRKQAFLATFDGADTNDTSPDRPISTTSLQALFMLNDPFLHEQADKLATRVGLAIPDEPQRIGYTYQLLFGRPPEPEELSTGAQYLRDVQARLKQTGVPWDQQYRQSLASYVRVLMSANEFVWLD